MKIIDKAVDKSVQRHINKLRNDNPYEYNSLLTPDRMEALRDRYTRSVLVNSVWYGGNDLELKKLYQQDLKAFKIGHLTSDELNYFWATNTEGMNIRKIHAGIPQLISEKMVDLLLSNGYEYTVYEDYDEDIRDDDNQERLEAILEYNNFELQLQEAVETESWSGGVAIKLSDATKYDYPILEVVQPEDYEATIEAGRIIEDIFITFYNRKNESYKLKEIYGVGYINYKLYKLNKSTGNSWLECNLNEVDETKDLKDIKLPIMEKFSIYKPNKLPNSEFRGSRMGESDYSGSVGMFDAIDEVVSTMIQEFRDGKIKNFWPSNLLPVDPFTKESYLPPALKKDFITYNSGIGEKEKADKPEMIQGDIHSEKYIEVFKKLLEVVINNAGLSPQTLGITGLESSSASEESQELREKASIRTREKKVKLWIPSMNKLFELLLMMDDMHNGQTPNEYQVKTIFNDYKIQTIADKTDIASKGILGKTWDIKTAVQYVHDDLTPEEQTLMAVNIKIEQGIMAFTKEEELVYKKYIAEVVEQEVPQGSEFDEIEEELEAEPIEVDDGIIT